MERIVFKKEDLSLLPIPQVGYKTIGIDTDGGVKTIDDLGNIELIGGSGGTASATPNAYILTPSTRWKHISNEINKIVNNE